jgi:hypothetical protein
MSRPSVIPELESKLSKLRETAQSSAFRSVWPQSSRRQMIDEILEIQRSLDAARRGAKAGPRGRLGACPIAIASTATGNASGGPGDTAGLSAGQPGLPLVWPCQAPDAF